MANTLLTVDAIAQRALATLYSSLTVANLVWRDTQQDFSGTHRGYSLGNVINVRKPATFTAETYSRGSGITIQNGTETSVAVTLDTIADTSFAVTSEDMTHEIESLDERLIAPAAESIAQKIDTEVIAAIKAAALAASNTVGTDDVAATDAVATIVNARKILQDNKVPLSERYGVWETGFESLALQDPTFHEADKRGDTLGLREASIGRKFGIDHFVSQNISDGDSAVFHRSAVALATVPLALPSSSVESSVMSYKGLTLRVVKSYDIDQKQDVISIDCLYGIDTLDGERAVLVYGAA